MFLKEAIENLVLKFKHAIAGVLMGIAHDRSLRLHYIIAAGAILVFYYLKVSVVEWGMLLLGIGVIIGLEYLNSAIELLCDHVQEEFHETIKTIKDFGAAAVLVAALFVGVMGLMILLNNIK
ncbi:MAG: diacylglycerol kinase [Erysipelothrix sp.]|jgi:diacylglycerol kinase|nr:diacylglycerol kinase [Erysipelothrix sp.]